MLVRVLDNLFVDITPLPAMSSEDEEVNQISLVCKEVSLICVCLPTSQDESSRKTRLKHKANVTWLGLYLFLLFVSFLVLFVCSPSFLFDKFFCFTGELYNQNLVSRGTLLGVIELLFHSELLASVNTSGSSSNHINNHNNKTDHNHNLEALCEILKTSGRLLDLPVSPSSAPSNPSSPETSSSSSSSSASSSIDVPDSLFESGLLRCSIASLLQPH
jgi:hypothetical protein